MRPTLQPDQICPICSAVVAAGIPVVFDRGTVAHLDCYLESEGASTVARNFLVSRPGKPFCYTCLAQHLTRERQEIEKAANALRLNRKVVVEPATCSTCTHARVTIRVKQATDDASPPRL
jgi:hypothetical protein